MDSVSIAHGHRGCHRWNQDDDVTNRGGGGGRRQRQRQHGGGEHQEDDDDEDEIVVLKVVPPAATTTMTTETKRNKRRKTMHDTIDDRVMADVPVLRRSTRNHETTNNPKSNAENQDHPDGEDSKDGQFKEEEEEEGTDGGESIITAIKTEATTTNTVTPLGFQEVVHGDDNDSDDGRYDSRNHKSINKKSKYASSINDNGSDSHKKRRCRGRRCFRGDGDDDDENDDFDDDDSDDSDYDPDCAVVDSKRRGRRQKRRCQRPSRRRRREETADHMDQQGKRRRRDDHHDDDDDECADPKSPQGGARRGRRQGRQGPPLGDGDGGSGGGSGGGGGNDANDSACDGDDCFGSALITRKELFDSLSGGHRGPNPLRLLSPVSFSGGAAVATKQGRVSHIVIKEEYNAPLPPLSDFLTRTTTASNKKEQEEGDVIFYTLHRYEKPKMPNGIPNDVYMFEAQANWQPTASRVQQRPQQSVPLFWEPTKQPSASKTKACGGPKRVRYVGHWIIDSVTRQKYTYKNQKRCAKLRFRFDRLDRQFCQIINDFVSASTSPSSSPLLPTPPAAATARTRTTGTGIGASGGPDGDWDADQDDAKEEDTASAFSDSKESTGNEYLEDSKVEQRQEYIEADDHYNAQEVEEEEEEEEEEEGGRKSDDDDGDDDDSNSTNGCDTRDEAMSRSSDPGGSLPEHSNRAAAMKSVIADASALDISNVDNQAAPANIFKEAATVDDDITAAFPPIDAAVPMAVSEEFEDDPVESLEALNGSLNEDQEDTLAPEAAPIVAAAVAAAAIRNPGDDADRLSDGTNLGATAGVRSPAVSAPVNRENGRGNEVAVAAAAAAVGVGEVHVPIQRPPTFWDLLVESLADPGTTESTLEMLIESITARTNLLDTNIVSVIKNIMTQALDTDLPTRIGKLCHLVTQFCLEPQFVRKFVEASVHEPVTAAMQAYPNDRSIQHHGCTLLIPFMEVHFEHGSGTDAMDGQKCWAEACGCLAHAAKHIPSSIPHIINRNGVESFLKLMMNMAHIVDGYDFLDVLFDDSVHGGGIKGRIGFKGIIFLSSVYESTNLYDGKVRDAAKKLLLKLIP